MRTRVLAKEMSYLVPKFIANIKENIFKIEELTSRQVVILMYIKENPSSKITKIAQVFKISCPTVTGIVDRLVKLGYLKRIRGEKDRREVFVELAPKAQRFLKKFLNLIEERWSRILSKLTPKERKEFVRIFKKILKNLEG